MYCTKCGNELRGNFCSKCGERAVSIPTPAQIPINEQSSVKESMTRGFDAKKNIAGKKILILIKSILINDLLSTIYFVYLIYIFFGPQYEPLKVLSDTLEISKEYYMIPSIIFFLISVILNCIIYTSKPEVIRQEQFFYNNYLVCCKEQQQIQTLPILIKHHESIKILFPLAIIETGLSLLIIFWGYTEIMAIAYGVILIAVVLGISAYYYYMWYEHNQLKDVVTGKKIVERPIRKYVSNYRQPNSALEAQLLLIRLAIDKLLNEKFPYCSWWTFFHDDISKIPYENELTIKIQEVRNYRMINLIKLPDGNFVLAEEYGQSQEKKY